MALRRASKKFIGLGLWHSHGFVREFSTFSLPDLPYDYWALEPVIMTEIMKLHHQQHHQSYVTNYNNALVRLEHALTMADSPTIVRLQSAIKFNGGGHINHSIFWKNLSPVKELGGKPPKPFLGSAIDTQYGSLDALIQKVNAEGAALQGSGWVVSFRNFFELLSELHRILKWLALDKERKQLSVETTADQDPLVTKGSALVPLIGIDVWEHAYYLQYRDVKSNYLKNIWKVINWKYASEIYEKECL